LKFTQTHDVYKDMLTGVCYSKCFTVKPIAVIDGPEKSTTFGVLLEPYGNHAAVDWDSLEKLESANTRRERLGFDPNCWGQSVFVTEEQLATRFEYLGKLSKDLDMEAAVRHLEEEHCDFSDREEVARLAIRQLKQLVPAKWACTLYTMLKDYQANTRK
jgi:hypothetical protein